MTVPALRTDAPTNAPKGVQQLTVSSLAFLDESSDDEATAVPEMEMFSTPPGTQIPSTVVPIEKSALVSSDERESAFEENADETQIDFPTPPGTQAPYDIDMNNCTNEAAPMSVEKRDVPIIIVSDDEPSEPKGTANEIMDLTADDMPDIEQDATGRAKSILLEDSADIKLKNSSAAQSSVKKTEGKEARGTLDKLREKGNTKPRKTPGPRQTLDKLRNKGGSKGTARFFEGNNTAKKRVQHISSRRLPKKDVPAQKNYTSKGTDSSKKPVNRSKREAKRKPKKQKRKVENRKAEERKTEEPSPFSLPVTQTLLKENPLDGEVRKGCLKKSAVFQRSSMRQKKRQCVQLSKESNLIVAKGNWASLEAAVEPTKEVVEKPTSSAIARDWHSMPTLHMTPELVRDIRVIENRQHIDPKRFYKSSGSGRAKGELPEHMAFGTVVEGAHEFYSSRLTKRERRKSITDEIMSDDRVMKFTKTRVRAIQKHATRQRRVIDPAAKKGRYNR